MNRYQGYAERGGGTAQIAAPNSSSIRFQQSFPMATVTVYMPGTTTLATLYSDDGVTVKANPFTADQYGWWEFYSAATSLDIQFSGTGVPTWIMEAVPPFDVDISNAIFRSGGLQPLSADLELGNYRVRFRNSIDIVNVSQLVTGGSGTSVDPWTGWETALQALPVYSNIYFEAGYYTQATGIVVKTGWHINGSGKGSAIITSSFTGTAFRTDNPLNGSYGINVRIENIYIKNTNTSNVGSGILEVCGTYVTVRQVTVYGFKYGITFNQTELSEIIECECVFQLYAGIWLVNGSQYNLTRADIDLSAAQPEFTNRITIQRCQINQNSTVYGILDEGGYAHTIKDNNYNGGYVQLYVAGVYGLSIEGGEFEAANLYPIWLHYQKATDSSGSGSGFGKKITGGVIVGAPCIRVSTGVVTVDSPCFVVASPDYAIHFDDPSFADASVVINFTNSSTGAVSNYAARGTHVSGGRVSATNGIRTNSRTVNDNEPVDIAFNAANFAASGAGTWTVEAADQLYLYYVYNGKLMTVYYGLNNTTVAGGPANLIIPIPGGHTAARRAEAPIAQVRDAGTQITTASAIVLSGGTQILFQKDSAASGWAAATNTTRLLGSITFPIN